MDFGLVASISASLKPLFSIPYFPEMGPDPAGGQTAAFKPHRSSNSACSSKQSSANYRDLCKDFVLGAPVA